MPFFPHAGVRRIRMFLIACASLLILAAPGRAVASTPSSTIGISPVGTSASYFTVTMSPGSNRRLWVELSNDGDSPAQALTYAANVYSIINGGFGARLSNQAKTGVTNWLAYPTTTILLAGRRAEKRSFTILVPNTASPGEHITSLVVQSEKQVVSKWQVAFNQISRQALPVVIDVPGPREARLSIGTVHHATVDGLTVIALPIANTGNIRIHPAGQFIVRNDHGFEVADLPVMMGTVYPGNATAFRDTFKSILAAGRYTVTATLGDSAVGIATETKTEVLEITAPSPGQVPTNTTTPPAVPQRTGHIPVELLAGLIMALLLAGAAGVFGAEALRRRRIASHSS